MAKRIPEEKAATRNASKAKPRKAGASQSDKKNAAGKRSKAKATAKKSIRTRTAVTKSTRARGAAKTVSIKTIKKVKAVSAAKETAQKKPANKKGARRAPAPKQSPATALDPIQFPEEANPMPKTYLNPKELQEFKELVLAKRRELAGDVTHLTDEVTHRKSQGESQRSAMPIHMADIGSDNWEHEFTIGLIANERALLREIDEALERIENGTYGICCATHKRISKARLRAKPWAQYCIDYARARDEGRAP